MSWDWAPKPCAPQSSLAICAFWAFVILFFAKDFFCPIIKKFK